MIDFTYNPIIPADYKSRGRGLPYEASPFVLFFVEKYRADGLKKFDGPERTIKKENILEKQSEIAERPYEQRKSIKRHTKEIG